MKPSSFHRFLFMFLRHLLFLFLLAGFLPGRAQINADSLAGTVHLLKGRQKVITLSDISFGYAYSNPDKCLQYARLTLKEAQRLKNDTLVSEGFNAMAIAFYLNSEHDSALQYNFKALDIRKKLNDDNGQASSLSKIGTIYIDQGKYTESIEIFLRLLRIFEKNGNHARKAATLTNLVNAYLYLKDMEKSGRYNRLSLEMVPQLQDRLIIARIYGNAGSYFEKTNHYDSALIYSNKALDIFLANNSLSEVSSVYNNMGIVYSRQGNLAKALEQYQKAYDISKKIENYYDMAYYGANAAFILIKLDRLPEAEKYLLEARSLAEEHKYLFIQRMVYGSLSNLKEKQGKTAEALKFHKLYVTAKDSLLNAQKSRAIEEMEARYQNEKHLSANRALEIEKKNEQIKRQKAETANANKTKYIFVLALGSVVVLLLVLVFYQYRQRRQREIYNRQILFEKEQGVKAVLTATEEERKRIAKDLHDGIGQQMGGLKLAWQSISGEIYHTNPEQFAQLTKITAVLDDTSKEIRNISHRMMPRVLTEMGLKEAIDDMLRKTLELSPIEYQFESFGIDRERFEERIEISLYRICQELVNNVIKHSNARSMSVQLILKDPYLVLIVEDDGQGFDASQKKGGIGLMNIHTRVDTVNGRINYEASEGSGTTATVRVPIRPL